MTKTVQATLGLLSTWSVEECETVIRWRFLISSVFDHSTISKAVTPTPTPTQNSAWSEMVKMGVLMVPSPTPAKSIMPILWLFQYFLSAPKHESIHASHCFSCIPNKIRPTSIGKVPNFEWVLTLNEFWKNLIFSRSEPSNGKPFGGRIYAFIPYIYTVFILWKAPRLIHKPNFWTHAKQFFEQKPFRKFGKTQDRWSLMINEIVHACS